MDLARHESPAEDGEEAIGANSQGRAELDQLIMVGEACLTRDFLTLQSPEVLPLSEPHALAYDINSKLGRVLVATRELEEWSIDLVGYTLLNHGWEYAGLVGGYLRDWPLHAATNDSGDTVVTLLVSEAESESGRAFAVGGIAHSCVESVSLVSGHEVRRKSVFDNGAFVVVGAPSLSDLRAETRFTASAASGELLWETTL